MPKFGFALFGAVAADPTVNLVELAQSVDDLSTLVTAVVAGDLVDTLSSPGPFTVFAPENKAFAGLPDGTLDTLLKPENKGQLVDILTYHVLPAQVLSTDLKPWQRVATVEGSTVDVVPAGNQVLVLDSNYKASVVISADNLATNGVAHIINGVLMPPAKVIPGPRKTEPTQNIVELAQSVDSLSTLVAAVVAGDLVDTLSSPGPFTVFAPTNDAFDALPKGTLDSLLKPENKDQLVDILTFHVLPSQVLSTDLKPWNKVKTVQGGELEVIPAGDRVLVLDGKYKVSNVVQADNLATNGVAHVIDGVLMPGKTVVV